MELAGKWFGKIHYKIHKNYKWWIFCHCDVYRMVHQLYPMISKPPGRAARSWCPNGRTLSSRRCDQHRVRWGPNPDHPYDFPMSHTFGVFLGNDFFPKFGWPQIYPIELSGFKDVLLPSPRSWDMMQVAFICCAERKTARSWKMQFTSGHDKSSRSTAARRRWCDVFSGHGMMKWLVVPNIVYLGIQFWVPLPSGIYDNIGWYLKP